MYTNGALLLRHIWRNAKTVNIDVFCNEPELAASEISNMESDLGAG